MLVVEMISFVTEKLKKELLPVIITFLLAKKRVFLFVTVKCCLEHKSELEELLKK